MSTTVDTMSNGLTPEHDLFFAEKPDDPEMRESTSIWLFEENGEFALPRIGIEAEAKVWDNRVHQANFALGGGRILDGLGAGPGPSPFGPDGRPTIFGAGPLTFRCLEPFRRWAMTYDGTAVDGTVDQQIHRALDRENRVPVRIDVEMEMATPAWVHDYSPEKVAKMSDGERAEAQSMGLGWRLEHTFRGEGSLTVDGGTREFRCVGSRIKRQSVRPLMSFRGHCWQSALFPDGRAFGFITYPPAGDGSEPMNDGYIYQDGKMHPARATKIPWLRRLLEEGDDVSLEMESALGPTRIEASTALTTYRIMSTADGLPVDFNLHQGGARYTWDGMTSYGMIERSCTADQLTSEAG
jgi:hypothetical protein